MCHSKVMRHAKDGATQFLAIGASGGKVEVNWTKNPADGTALPPEDAYAHVRALTQKEGQGGTYAFETTGIEDA